MIPSQPVKKDDGRRYGCQSFDVLRLCRYFGRETDARCSGCLRTTDTDYLKQAGLMK